MVKTIVFNFWSLSFLRLTSSRRRLSFLFLREYIKRKRRPCPSLRPLFHYSSPPRFKNQTNFFPRPLENPSTTMASPRPRGYTLEEFKAFHNIDRQIYARLVAFLRIDRDTSKKIVAFWNYLKEIGHGDFISTVLPLSDQMLAVLAMEAMTCLIYWLDVEGCQPPSHNVDKDLPLMISLLEPKFSFQPLYTDRKNVMTKIKEFVWNVCDFAFSVTFPTTILFLKP